MTNPTSSEQQILSLSTLLQLEKEARHAKSHAELGFIMVNETLKLVKYRQTILWIKGSAGKIRIEAVSGADKPDKYSPFIIYLINIVKEILLKPDHDKIHTVDLANLSEASQKGRQEWNIGGPVIWSPLITPKGEIIGGLILIRDTLWNTGEIRLIERLADTYAHAWQALKKEGAVAMKFNLSTPKKLILQSLLMFIIIALMFLPVRLSVLAPVEIVPLNPMIISSPMDGIIQQIHVEPNQEVKAGQLLFSFDDTGIRNEYEISKKTLGVVLAEYDLAKRKALAGDENSKEDMAVLKAQTEQKYAERDYMAALLERSKVYAKQNGIALFSDVNNWRGKSVIVGEKVMSIVNPNHAEAEIHLPVSDAVNLDTGAEVLIFLNIRPDSPLSASLRQASYEAQITSEGILTFCLKASLKNPFSLRIGLRGTAKIYGKEVTLFYYLMRRPLTALRQRLGL